MLPVEKFRARSHLSTLVEFKHYAEFHFWSQHHNKPTVLTYRVSMLELTNLYMAHNSKGRKSNSPREADHGKEAAFSTVSLLQGIFLNQGSNPGLLHCRQILYHLSQQGSPVNLLINLKKERESTFKREKESVPAYLVQNGRLLFYFVELGNEKHHS